MKPLLNVALTEEDWSRVLTYLAEFPFKNVAALMTDIRNQIIPQIDQQQIKPNGELHDRPGVVQ